MDKYLHEAQNCASSDQILNCHVTEKCHTYTDGPFDAACKAVYAQIETAGLKGITERELARSVAAFRNMEPRRRKEVLEALAGDKGVTCRNLNEGKRGKPRFAWLAADVEEEPD